MPDATDLAATLRRFAEPNCSDCEGSGVVAEYHGGGNTEMLGCPSCFATGVTPSVDAHRSMVEIIPAVASALERGAAAEAVTERVRWEGEHDYGIGSELRGLIAAYDALTDERDLTWYRVTMDFALDHHDPASPSPEDIFEYIVDATPDGLVGASHSMGPADDVE